MFHASKISLGLIVALSVGNESFAQEFCDTLQCDELYCDTYEPSGSTRSNEAFGLTGDWLGVRTSFANCGVTTEADTVHFYQGVAHGGRREAFNYAGHGDYILKFDFDKMMGLQGWSLMTRAEHRWGESVALDSGALLSPSLHSLTPSPETEDVIVTNFLFTKVVNENVTTFFGKLDTLDGDRNLFASGRGKTQFMNTSLLLPVSGLPTVPLATLGAGSVFFVDGLPLGQVIVLNATDTVESSGFDELFDEGAVILASLNLPLPIAGKSGVHTLSYGWSSRDFVSLGQDPRILLPRVPIQRTEDSWLVWWSGTQFLYEDPNDPFKGWGLFGRAGAADPEVNPVEFFYNAGIGGQSPLPGREQDLFGIGWFYNRFSDRLGPIANTVLDLGRDSTGVEAYYNYAATNCLRISPDVQVIEPGSNRANTALIVGLRGQMIY